MPIPCLRRTYDERVCTSTRFGVRRLSAVNYFFCAESDGYTFLVLVQGRKFQGTKVPGNESSIIPPKLGLGFSVMFRATPDRTGPELTDYFTSTTVTSRIKA